MNRVKSGHVRVIVYFTRLMGNGSRYNVVMNIPKKRWLTMKDSEVDLILDIMFSYREKWADAFTMVEWCGEMHNFSC